MPLNPVGSDSAEPDGGGVDEAAWRAQNLPATKLEFRWRYASGQIQLYERRLRSLSSFHVGPAVQAWVRSRLEWMQDNRLRQQPEGVLVLTIDPEGDVGMSMESLVAAPVLDEAAFLQDGAFRGDADFTLWAVAGGEACASQPLAHAVDTFTRDLLGAFGVQLRESCWDGGVPQGAELFATCDEFGVISCQGRVGAVVAKLEAAFEKLWS